MVDHPGSHRRQRPRRGAVLAAFAVLVAAGVAADRSAAAPHPPAVAAVASQPAAAPADAVSSSWYCAGATASQRGQAAGTVVISNPTGTRLTARVELLASGGGQESLAPTTVAPYSRTVVAEDPPGHPSWVGAVVVLDGGGAAVEQEVSGPLGTAATPCADRGSTRWYFPTGTTLRDATDVVSLLNPFPADAIVDLSFVTNEGAEAPLADQAVLVPAGSLVAVNLGDHLRRRQTIATMVTATAGQVVAWQTQLVTAPASGTPVIGQPAPAGYSGMVDPAPPTAGAQLTLGAPAPATVWSWPDGVAGHGVNEEYVIFNPGSTAALLRLTYGSTAGGEQPLGFTVGPGSVRSIVTTSQPEVPSGAPHDASLVSTNGVPVVAERTVTAVSPSSRTGLGGLLGSTVTARRWLIGDGGGTRRHLDEWIIVQVPGTLPATVALDQVGPAGVRPLPGLGAIAVKAGQRVAVDITARLRGATAGPLVVIGSRPLVVERDLYGTGGTGISLALGVPLRP
jgi:hypothetical protein